MSKKKKNRKLDSGKKIPLTPPPKERSFPFHHFIAVALIAVVALLAYSNTFHVPFHFDDQINIINNPNIQIKQFSWDGLEHLVKNTYKESIRVFSLFTLALNYYFGGFNVFGYHLVNFFIHVASGIFLYWSLILTFNLPSLKEKYGSISYKVALFSSLIFICHPIQTQSVTYIVQRMSSMAGMFYLLSLILYIKGRLSFGRTRLFYFGGMVLSYLLGIFSKENAAILPLFVALYEFYFFQNFDLSPKGKKILFSLVGGLLILVVFGFIIWGQRYINVIAEGYKYRTFTMWERVLTQFRVVLYYVTLLIYPHPSRLNLDHDFPISKTILDPPTTLISLFIIAGLIGYSIWTAKKRPVLSFCLLWYFGNLVIESSIFPLEMVFEHRLYLPAVGPFILFSLFMVRGIEKLKRRGSIHRTQNSGLINQTPNMKMKRFNSEIADWSILFFIMLFLLIGTYQRNSLWNSEVELWKDCVRKSPQKERTHHNLGNAYYELGRWDEAKEKFEEALRIEAHNALSHNSLGVILARQGRFQEAIAHWKETLRITPDFADAHNNLGNTLVNLGKYQEAIAHYNEALRIKPGFADAHHNLGGALSRLGRHEEAIAHFTEALKIRPDFAEARGNLGNIFTDLGRVEEAIAQYNEALRIKPDFAEVRLSLGLAYLRVGNRDSAMKEYEILKRINPDLAKALYSEIYK